VPATGRLLPRLALRRLVLALALLACAATTADAQERVHLDKAEALATVFPGASRVVELRHLLAPDELTAIEDLLGKRLAEGGFYIYAGWAGDAADAPASAPSGYAVVVSEVGKVRPITHIVEVTPAGEVGKVAVMIYREGHGADVASERFMQQYRGMTLDDPIRVERDVIHIAGSTLSAHAICRGVRKALAVVQVVLLDRPLAERLALLADGNVLQTTPAADAAARASAGHARAERRVMGTLCRVEAWADLDDTALAAALDEALDEVARWDAVLSDWSPDTPLSRLNAAPVGEAFDTGADLMAWLRHARRWHAETGGAFDPGVGALVAAWGLRTQSPLRPGKTELASALAASGLDGLALDEAEDTATRRTEGLRLDPGASGKGWALDAAARVLKQRGVERALLDFRSTLLALGPPPGRSGWPVPIVHEDAEAPVAELLLAHEALSVSGGNRASWVDEGVGRGNVLDPATGVPVPAGRLAWARHASAAVADALSTALLVRGPALPAADGAAGVFLEHAAAPPVAWPVDG
jgi:thiamine biosynthesis lipoprotein